MKNRQTWLLLIVAGIAVSSALIIGQIRDAAALAAVSQLTTLMAQPSPDTRLDAFYQLIEMGSGNTAAGVGPAALALLKDYPEKSEEIRDTFTRTLETENRVVKSGASLNEDYATYYGDLITAVVSFNDTRSVESLSNAMGSGNMVIRRLVSFGEAALEPVLEQLGTDPATRSASDPLSKQAASIVLGLLLDPANPAGIQDPATRNRIKEALKTAARDLAGGYIRTAAVEALAKVDDVDVVRFLTEIGGKDGFQATAGKPTSFPVREAAALALAKLGQNSESAAGKPAIEGLTKLGTNPGARSAAAQALTNLVGDTEATPPVVRNAARDALLKLGLGTQTTQSVAASERTSPDRPAATPPTQGR
jgi:hypothetical protein